MTADPIFSGSASIGVSAPTSEYQETSDLRGIDDASASSPWAWSLERLCKSSLPAVRAALLDSHQREA